MDPDKKERRRSSRGRRSMAVVTTDGKSPTSLPVLSGSINESNKVLDLRNRIDDIDNYMTSLNSEIDSWQGLMRRYKEINNKSIELPLKRPSKGVSMPELTGLRPRYLLNRAEKLFFDRYTECNKQKDIDVLTEQKEKDLKEIKKYDKAIASLQSLYNEQPLEQIEADGKAWGEIMKKTQSHLHDLSIRESVAQQTV
ncbi:unnamed protein product [Auanema sp. JU1783]|nr:unnamed protein product [Auanema sp. JU1783]